MESPNKVIIDLLRRFLFATEITKRKSLKDVFSRPPRFVTMLHLPHARGQSLHPITLDRIGLSDWDYTVKRVVHDCLLCEKLNNFRAVFQIRLDITTIHGFAATHDLAEN